MWPESWPLFLSLISCLDELLREPCCKRLIGLCATFIRGFMGLCACRIVRDSMVVRFLLHVVLVTLLFGRSVLLAQTNQWPQWRGPERNGVSSEIDLPLEWSDTKNVLWKVAIEGRGHSTRSIFLKFKRLQSLDSCTNGSRIASDKGLVSGRNIFG